MEGADMPVPICSTWHPDVSVTVIPTLNLFSTCTALHLSTVIVITRSRDIVILILESLRVGDLNYCVLKLYSLTISIRMTHALPTRELHVSPRFLPTPFSGGRCA